MLTMKLCDTQPLKFFMFIIAMIAIFVCLIPNFLFVSSILRVRLCKIGQRDWVLVIYIYIHYIFYFLNNIIMYPPSTTLAAQRGDSRWGRGTYVRAGGPTSRWQTWASNVPPSHLDLTKVPWQGATLPLHPALTKRRRRPKKKDALTTTTTPSTGLT
jgi:hypothetical protein